MTGRGDPDPGDLRARFAELREQEGPTAPGFDETWDAATARARERPGRSGARVLFLGAGLATATGLAAAAALALFIVSRPGFGAMGDAPAATRTDRATLHATPPPLGFLLAPPAPVAITPDPVDPFRYRLDRVLENAASGAAQ